VIRYDLQCAAGHGFDGWFRSSADFDAQASRNLVSCPVCGSSAVEKALMAPALSRGARTAEPAEQEKANAGEVAAKVSAPPAEPVRPVALMGEREQEMRAMLRAVREHLTANSDNVGDAFARQARAMHYEEVERRTIHGKATLDEVRELHEEGITFSALPTLPDDLS
jgi:hypothetical protein